MAKLNTNGNAYTIIYAAVMVVIVAFLLAFVASALKPTQDANVALDTKKQILASLNIRDIDNAEAEAKYAEVITSGELKSPTLTANVDGEEKLIVAMKGAGLWGGLWGWVSINKDGQTVYGSFFNHESETAGLGARITEQWFQDEFKGKVIFDAEGNVVLGVYKKGKAPATLSADSYVDAVTGATLTSNGVSDMIQKCITDNKSVIQAFSGNASNCQPAKECCKEACGECCKEACGDCCKEACGECCKEACGDCCKEGCGECCKEGCGECCKEACGECCKEGCGKCCDTSCTNKK